MHFEKLSPGDFYVYNVQGLTQKYLWSEQKESLNEEAQVTHCKMQVLNLHELFGP
jgi:hypothetical protein